MGIIVSPEKGPEFSVIRPDPVPRSRPSTLQHVHYPSQQCDLFPLPRPIWMQSGVL